MTNDDAICLQFLAALAAFRGFTTHPFPESIHFNDQDRNPRLQKERNGS